MSVALGTMSLCGANGWGEPRQPEQMQLLLKTAYEGGIRCYDSAGFYGPDVALRLLNQYLPKEDDLIIATKVGLSQTSAGRWVSQMAPSEIVQQVEQDLKTLQRERLDAVFLRLGDGQHLPRSAETFAEALHTLCQLQQQGKIRAIGLSQCTVQDVQDAQQHTAIFAVQNRYNLRQADDPVLHYCQQQQMPYWAYSPLASGGLLRRAIPRLASMAEKYGVSPAQLALAWLQSSSPVLLPVVGTANVQHVQDNIASSLLRVSAVDRAILQQLLDQ